MKTKLLIPRVFFQDHYERDLNEHIEILNWGKFVVTVLATNDEIDELLSDAHHYGCGGMDWSDPWDDAERQSIRTITRSAQSTCAQLRKLTGDFYGHKAGAQ